MKYMILQLNQEKYIDDVLLGLTESGINESIVLSGETLEHKLTFNNPIFAGFREVVDQKKSFGSVIMAYVEDKEQVDFFLEELKRTDLDLIKDQIAKIILLPISEIYQ